MPNPAADPAATAASKASMRKAARSALAGLVPEARLEAAARAAAMVAGTEAYRGASLVLAFLSMPSEIDTSPLVNAALASGRRVAVPRIEGGDIAFVELTRGWRDWPRDRWEIPEPPASATPLAAGMMASTPTVAAVPGLAFDRSGGRLGRGKGYYDRFLAAVAAERTRLGPAAAPFSAIGYGFAAQLVDLVPTGPGDVVLDGLALG